MKKVAIIMGSKSDWQIAQKAVDVLSSYGIPHTVMAASAHRTPELVRDFALSARENGFGAIIALAGMAAHLAGAIAANTTLPVVGVPVKSGDLGGLDALLSTVQMPPGIPVATVAVNGAANAAHLCAQMLGITDETLKNKLAKQRETMEREAIMANEALQNERSGEAT